LRNVLNINSDNSCKPNRKEDIREFYYPDLAFIPKSVYVVDVFRGSEDVPPVVEETTKVGAKAAWMQEGVINEEAVARAKEAGLVVVMNKCMHREHHKLEKQA
jgi:predicted CoA-binding protein